MKASKIARSRTREGAARPALDNATISLAAASETSVPRIDLSPSTQPPLADRAAARLETLCRAARYERSAGTVGRTFRRLLSECGFDADHAPAGWVSEISDDNTPVEFSVAISDGNAEVRTLFEPQGQCATVESYRLAGLAFNRRLEQHYGADLSRFRRVEDLFLPPGMQGPFAVWSSAVFSKDGGPSFKAYLNTQAHGVAHAEKVVEEGLRRFGLERAWSRLRETVLRRGSYLDELKYLALDLTSTKHARIKVYVRHHEATLEDLELAASGAASYRPGETIDFARAMRGSDDCLHARAGFTCSSFAGEESTHPVATTVYVPVCAYARDDAAVTNRVRDYLVGQKLDAGLYRDIIHGFANRPLEAGVGMQSWTAFRRHAQETRLTVYLATEANRMHAPGEVPAPTPDRTAFRPLPRQSGIVPRRASAMH